ncbi:type VI secretion system Vgr family protein [Chitinophaga sp. sic0106]|uniref:type VI secretion system Vgr family protein n=1 Tax=Chitinophaga sp. sic0106 TaxID=2854785 RepID=UPI001C446CB2|nr:phage baseplate assembly protein V [Chitinophaga sp. sic0106]MBV7529413.1 type IV secretion protein Rhs [Chitinophaga sp. sic0106]
MEGKLKVTINIEDTPILHFSAFTLEQRFNAHHYFELRFNHDEQGAPGMISLEKSRAFMGKSITVQFGKEMGKEQLFVGKVTRVELSQSHGYHGTLIISGYSPSILIDRGPDLGSYLNKDLSGIIRKATQDAPANELNLTLNPARKEPVDYMIQYRESDYDFINRLSAEYHEWFFYDGTKLHFGKPEKQEEVKLVYGRDVNSLQYAMQVAPLKSRKFAYKPADDELFKAEAKAQAGGQPDLAHAVNASNELYSKVYSQPTNVRIDTKKEMDTFVENEDKANIADLLQITATGDNPEVGLGKIVDVSMSVKEALSFSVQQLGRFLVTAVYHHIDGVGHYYHTFEGITADAEKVPVREYDRPFADMQLAIVEDNNDPKGQGRVKVKFKWECSCNDASEWLRVVTPDAGSSDKVSKNRGFTFIPEKGDQVVVAFEEGNTARPLVMGSVFHGKTGSGGGSANGVKSLTTRTGSTVTLDDNKGSVTVKDPSGNVLIMHGDGTVTLNAPQKMIINTTDFVLNASNSVTINAQPGEQGGGEGTVTISAKKSISGTADTEDISLTATARDVAINSAAGVYKLDSKEVSITATEKFYASGGARGEFVANEIEINQC